MPIEITARHMDATASIQESAKTRAQVILDEFPKVEHVHVILDVEKHRKIAEIVVQVKRVGKLEAQESSDSMGASLDLAVEKIEKQLRKLTDKQHDHHPAMKQSEAERRRATI